MDDHDKRVQKILGQERKRNRENSTKYLGFLRKNTKFPCRLTGIEDFLWEEPYVIGGWDKDEYESLKTENPSYADVYELIELLEPDSDDDDICAKVRRLTDLKIFEIGLSWLECLDNDDENCRLIKDYAVWHTNY